MQKLWTVGSRFLVLGRGLVTVCLVILAGTGSAYAQRADCSGGGPYSPSAITNMYNSSNNTPTNATIWVEVAAAAGNSNGAWGAEIIGLYYRPSGAGSWGPKLADDWAPVGT